MPKKILAPHREQEGWVYWRLRATTGKNAANAPTTNPLWLIKKVVKKDTLECVKASDIGLAVGYSDDTPGSRIISSRRVEEAVYQADRAREAGFTLKGAVNLYKWLKERGTDIGEAVETDDFLKLLNNEGLYASYWPDGGWLVAHPRNGGAVRGTTLREAYYRYKAQAGDAE